MGVTGRTENKLFKVRTLDANNLYQVGYNGVLDVSEDDNGLTKVKYEIDDILYTSYLSEDINTNLSDFNTIDFQLKENFRKIDVISNSNNRNSLIGDIEPDPIVGSRLVSKYKVSTDNNDILLRRRLKKNFIAPNQKTILSDEVVGDTIYETKSFSYDTFIETNIYKDEKYVGLISKPIVESDLFIERDEFAIFERHQRLSEIDNLAELVNYRGGYYKNIKTI